MLCVTSIFFYLSVLYYIIGEPLSLSMIKSELLISNLFTQSLFIASRFNTNIKRPNTCRFLQNISFYITYDFANLFLSIFKIHLRPTLSQGPTRSWEWVHHSVDWKNNFREQQRISWNSKMVWSYSEGRPICQSTSLCVRDNGGEKWWVATVDKRVFLRQVSTFVYEED